MTQLERETTETETATADAKPSQTSSSSSSPRPPRSPSSPGVLVREAAPAVVLATLIVLSALWVIPLKSRNPLAETSVWALLVMTAFAGWGSVVRLVVATRERIDLGLRMAWGAGLLCFIGGLMMVPALMVRTTALVLVEVGLILAIAALLRERHALNARLRFVNRFVRRDPALAIAFVVVAGIVATQCLSAIADWHTNPYDDDIAYLAFVKKLCDTGTVIEPFSFRRLSAYGGQTFFLEVVSVRAAPSQAHTWDRCVCFLMIVLLMSGYRHRGRRPSLLFFLTTVAMLATLPSIAINTASYYSGVVFFLALFRTLAWAGERRGAPSALVSAAWSNAIPIALVSVTACTLRQNYLPVPALTLAISYGIRLRRKWRAGESIRERLSEPLYAAILSIALLIPWFVVSWQSNHTFLYPVMPGTFHQPLALNASGWNFVREVAFQSSVAIDGLPLRTLGLFLLAAAFIREPNSRAPLGALCVGALVGFIALVHGLTQSDAQNIGRYAFAFLIALAIAVTLMTGTAQFPASASTSHRAGRLEIAAGIVLFSVLTQLVLSREVLWKDYGLRFRNIEALNQAAPRTRETDPPEVKLYQRLQASVPPGERLAVLVDEPHYLDFARNPIWNLDMPGYSSLPPGMPSFKGSEALEQYLRGLGLRWLMFVLPDASRYHYRREYFLELFVHEQEIWRTYAPYLIDFLDSEIAMRKRHRDVYYERGIVVIDLAEPRPPEQRIEPPPTPPPIPQKETEGMSDPKSSGASLPKGKEAR